MQIGYKGNLSNLNAHLKKDQTLLWTFRHNGLYSFFMPQQNKDGVKKSYSDNQECKPLFMEKLFKQK